MDPSILADTPQAAALLPPWPTKVLGFPAKTFLKIWTVLVATIISFLFGFCLGVLKIGSLLATCFAVIFLVTVTIYTALFAVAFWGTAKILAKYERVFLVFHLGFFTPLFLGMVGMSMYFLAKYQLHVAHLQLAGIVFFLFVVCLANFTTYTIIHRAMNEWEHDTILNESGAVPQELNVFFMDSNDNDQLVEMDYLSFV